MSFSSAQKGKARASPTPSSSSSLSASGSASDSALSSESESEAEDPKKYLDLARENIRAKAAAGKDDAFVTLADSDEEDDVIALEDPEDVLQCVHIKYNVKSSTEFDPENCRLLTPENCPTLTLRPARANEKTQDKPAISMPLAQYLQLISYSLALLRRLRPLNP